MPVLCPKCSQGLPPEDVNVAKDVAFCRTCNEAFSLSAQVGGASGPPRTSQPPATSVLLTRDDARIAAVIPPQGFKGAGCFLGFFALFWNGITWLVFLGFVGSMFGVVKSNSPTAPWMVIFFIPHIAVGIGVAIAAVFAIKGDVAIAMDKENVLMQRRLFGYTWSRSMPFAQISDVRMTEAYRSNGRSVQGVGFHFQKAAAVHSAGSSPVKSVLGKRTMNFGSGLSDDEKAWLLGEFHDYWSQHK